MTEINRHSPVYSIGVVKQLTGLSKRQIRYYEETELVIPERTSGNQRRYSLADVEKLLRVKKLLERGMNIDEVKSHFAEREDLVEETDTLSHLQELARNRDIKSKFQADIQALSDHGSSNDDRSSREEEISSDRPPQFTSRTLDSLYPVSNRAGLIQRLVEDQEEVEENEQEGDTQTETDE